MFAYLFYMFTSDGWYLFILYAWSQSVKNKICFDISIDPVEVPHENDILLGRGGNNNKHIGNEQLRLFAMERVQKYILSTKKIK